MYNDTTVENAGQGKRNGTVASSAAAKTASNAAEPEAQAALWDHFFGDWIWRAVECLVDVKGFNPSPRWISTRLGVSVEQAVDALDGLLELGLLKRDQDGGFVRNPEAVKPNIMWPIEQFNKAIESHYIMSNQIRSRMNVSKFNDLYMKDMIIAGSREDVDNCVRKINDAIMELHGSNSSDARDADVYGCSISFVSLTEDNQNA